MDLFREEAVQHRVQGLHGSISLALPTSWYLISMFLLAVLLLAMTALFNIDFTRTEVASGLIVPTGGIIQVMPQKAGRIDAIFVAEGQSVRAGQALARISAQDVDTMGIRTQSAILSTMRHQAGSIAEEETNSETAHVAEQAVYAQQIEGLSGEIDDLSIQIHSQERLVTLAEQDFNQASQIAERGFVSRRDLAQREETLLTRRQHLSELRSAQASKRSNIKQLLRSSRQAAAKAASELLALKISRSEIERQQASTRIDEGHLLTAPTTGFVAGLGIHRGDMISPQTSTMMIIPVGGYLIARLRVPGKAIGFVHAGQKVRFSFDAFPSERFGELNGRIASIASAPVMLATQDGNSAPFYEAKAAIQHPYFLASGQRYELRPGMTISARIAVSHGSMLHWLASSLFTPSR